MANFHIEPLAIPEVKLIRPSRFGDERGHFTIVFRAEAFAAAGLPEYWPQDNESHSPIPGTVRGFHYQAPPRAQAKLVRAARGRFFDAALDLRRNSPTYGCAVGAELSFENALMLYVPIGFGHCIYTIEPDTTASYKISDIYAPECEGGVVWNDPDIRFLGEGWPSAPPPAIINARDAALPRFREAMSPFL